MVDIRSKALYPLYLYAVLSDRLSTIVALITNMNRDSSGDDDSDNYSNQNFLKVRILRKVENVLWVGWM